MIKSAVSGAGKMGKLEPFKSYRKVRGKRIDITPLIQKELEKLGFKFELLNGVVVSIAWEEQAIPKRAAFYWKNPVSGKIEEKGILQIGDGFTNTLYYLAKGYALSKDSPLLTGKAKGDMRIAKETKEYLEAHLGELVTTQALAKALEVHPEILVSALGKHPADFRYVGGSWVLIPKK
jgi:hypothetical protein